MHRSVIDQVPDFARTELKAAGRCLAFVLNAASGFHSARAVECVLRHYCALYLPEVATESMTMGQIVSALEDAEKAKKKRTELPAKNTLRHLRDFTQFDRSPAIHRMVVVEEIDAHTLFNSATAVIVEMARTLKTANLTAPTANIRRNALAAPISGSNSEN